MKTGIILLIILLTAGCAQQAREKAQEKTSDTAMPQKPEYEPPPELPDEITIETHGLKFVPDEIIAKKGEKIKLKITAQEQAHTFELPDYGISRQLPVGKEAEIEIIADKEGEHTFYCNIPGHEGMKGRLIVR